MGKLNSLARYQKMMEKAIENQDYESLENIQDESFENAAAIAGKFGQPKVVLRKQGGVLPQGNPKPASIAAQFDLKITRDGVTSGSDLQIILFNPLNLVSKFSGLLVVPTAKNGGTLALDNVHFPDPTTLQFKYAYTDGGGQKSSEIISISCTNVPITTLMEGLKNAEFTISKMRFTADATDYASFFNEPLGTIRRSLLGKVSDLDTLPFASQKAPNNFAQNILDVDLNVHIQKDKGLTYSVPPSTKPLLLSIFVQNLFVQ